MSRQLLALALARFAGQTLTVEVARAIVAEASMDRDLSIDPIQFGTEHLDAYTLRAERVAGLEDELEPLHAAYMAEIRPGQAFGYSIADLREAERAGAVAQFTARVKRDDDVIGELVAIMRVRVSKQINTGHLKVSDDMFFVDPAHRGGFLAVKLWRFAEKAMFGFGVREADFDSLGITNAGRMASFLGYVPYATKFHKVAHEAGDYTDVPKRRAKGVADGSSS